MQGTRVKKIKYLGKQNTYNMEVKDHQNFSVNGGLIVHNSGYGIVSYHVNKSRGKIMTPEPLLPWPLRTDETPKEETNPFVVW